MLMANTELSGAGSCAEMGRSRFVIWGYLKGVGEGFSWEDVMLGMLLPATSPQNKNTPQNIIPKGYFVLISCTISAFHCSL